MERRSVSIGKGDEMSTKVNLVLEDEVKRKLDQLVPAGQRSRFANEALREKLEQVSRKQAARSIMALRNRVAPVPTDETVAIIRAARDEPR
jgi:predicted transcriptional regulator